MTYKTKEQFRARRKKIVALVESGWSVKGVAKLYNISVQRVYKILETEGVGREKASA